MSAAEMVEKENKELSVRKQCELLGICRSGLYREKAMEREESYAIKKAIDEIYLSDPSMGTRKLVTLLGRDYGLEICRKRITRLRKKMGLQTLYCKPKKMRTSDGNKEHKKYPYLLKEKEIKHADEVWCADITYIPMEKGHAYLCAVMDWKTRYVLGWEVSNTMDGALTLGALRKAYKTGAKLPEIFNTDQGSQFTSQEWIEELEGKGIRVSMDGKGRWMDNVFIERLWRSVKYEDIYLRGYGSVSELATGVSRWFKLYNTWRPHAALSNRTPERAYKDDRPEEHKEVA